jgi:hypothetical protein
MIAPLHEAALEALAADGSTIPDAQAHVPAAPGLYAVSGSASVWTELGLGDPPDDRPLYVGKAETSLASRDLRTHFATGRTGSSTLRRSIAALLVDRLELVACPRNPAKPGHFANYALEPGGDQRLTEWMLDRLRIAIWASPECDLAVVEQAVLRTLEPPLNLASVRTPWSTTVSAARRTMATAARAWTARPT